MIFTLAKPVRDVTVFTTTRCRRQLYSVAGAGAATRVRESVGGIDASRAASLASRTSPRGVRSESSRSLDTRSRATEPMDLVPWEARAFAGSLFVYHVSEYAIARAYNRATLSRDSFLFSAPYCVAMSLAMLEYALELALAPELKRAEWTRAISNRRARVRGARRRLAQGGAGHGGAAVHAPDPDQTQTRAPADHARRVPTHQASGVFGGGSRGASGRRRCCATRFFVAFGVAATRFFKARVPFEAARLRAMFPGSTPRTRREPGRGSREYRSR